MAGVGKCAPSWIWWRFYWDSSSMRSLQFVPAAWPCRRIYLGRSIVPYWECTAASNSLNHVGLTRQLRLVCGTIFTPNGSDVRPWCSTNVPCSSPLLRGRRGQCALPRGRMYGPGFRGHHWIFVSFVWKVCTAKGSDVRRGFHWRPWISASFAHQVWDNVHCLPSWQSSSRAWIYAPWGSSGVRGSPSLLRGKRAALAGKHINRLHCSEWNWRCPGPLPAVSPRAPACSKGCQHDSFWSWNFLTTAPLFG